MDNEETMELIESAASYAGILYNGLEKAVNDLREDNVRKGLSTLAQAIEGLEWLLNAVTIINQSKKNSDFETEHLKEFFIEMTNAAEDMDYVLLTDLIEYEILPIIDEWGIKLDTLLDNK